MSLTLNDFQRRNGIVNLSIFIFCLKMNNNQGIIYGIFWIVHLVTCCIFRKHGQLTQI